jgi:hypothetical protein
MPSFIKLVKPYLSLCLGLRLRTACLRVAKGARGRTDPRGCGTRQSRDRPDAAVRTRVPHSMLYKLGL